ncbi:MAG: alpha/beta fold hydrolase [Actinomycetota bacterium]
MPTTRTIEGAAVHTTGSGPPIVLLHANGGSHHDFDAIIPELSRHATVHAVDWPGHGTGDPIPEPSACGFAELLPAILEQLGEGPFTLVGNSVGGFAALRTAARRPDLVRNVVVVNPGGFTPRWPTTFLVCRLLGSLRIAPVAMRLLPRLYLRRRTPAVAAIRSAAVAASREPERVRTFARVWRSFTDPAHDARADAARITAPTLVVWGTRDPILPWMVDGRRARTTLRDARVVRLPCGHQAFAELPDEFLDATRVFLGGTDEEGT